MKKQLALLSVAAVLLTSGCSTKETPATSAGTQEATSESVSTSSAAESTEPAVSSGPLFRESSLYFERVTGEESESNYLAAASSKTPRSAEELGLTLVSADEESGRYEYKLDNIQVNAFVDYRSEEDISVIVDPAYMYNIPLPTLDSVPAENYVFDINGTKVVCDSLFVRAKSAVKEEYDEMTPDYSTSGYYYEAITMDLAITVSPDGTEATGSITAMEKLADAETAMDVCQLGDNAFDEKSGSAAETYRALLSIRDKLTAGDILGVNLIDLDFDGKPEVLVTREVKIESDYDWKQYTDVDIYSIGDSGLEFIDTLYNNDTGLIEGHGNVIGLKPLENGEKAWFTMSRINRTDENNANPADYLFTLKDGRLEFTEIFSSTGSFNVSEGDSEDAHYYMNGKELEFSVTYDYEPYYEPDNELFADAKPDWPYYHYGDYTAPFGKWEIYGWLREDYCKDITQTFMLYSSEFSYKKDWTGYQKLPITERMLDYKLANLTDAYYFGSYDPTIMNYSYWFLGGYAKPVIYLYPTETTDVNVKVDIDGELTCTYPDYRDGWNVTAYPDGTLIDKADGKEYYCLYWEGEGSAEWDMSRGEVVRGEDTAKFLEEKLTEIGLSPRERNEFIIYWLPRMQQNEFNYITFHTEDYAAEVPLEVTPQPDSVLRVFMVYASVPEHFEGQPQHFDGFRRDGFTVVEWGGGEAVISR
ncbi:MAG: hypothetical protein EGR45_01985 [Ruminococcaceae bacterium]|nr:hypothetical protein [Oscillospiraceae bacterium]